MISCNYSTTSWMPVRRYESTIPHKCINVKVFFRFTHLANAAPIIYGHCGFTSENNKPLWVTCTYIFLTHVFPWSKSPLVASSPSPGLYICLSCCYSTLASSCTFCKSLMISHYLFQNHSVLISAREKWEDISNSYQRKQPDKLQVSMSCIHKHQWHIFEILF